GHHGLLPHRPSHHRCHHLRRPVDLGYLEEHFGSISGAHAIQPVLHKIFIEKQKYPADLQWDIL
ncbi:MAG: hypothetical protein II683_07355, partial [Muribaculaceae bacterium]|nr:hypothetical protein [Muribaculaceae bacterium]